MSINPTNSFLEWYKSCCSLDSNIYRNTIYSLKKAKTYYNIIKSKDYVIYPLNGTQKLLFGDKEFCEEQIQKELNTKFLVFNLKENKLSEYLIKNDLVTII
jgi:hypothetical protein